MCCSLDLRLGVYFLNAKQVRVFSCLWYEDFVLNKKDRELEVFYCNVRNSNRQVFNLQHLFYNLTEAKEEMEKDPCSQMPLSALDR